MQTVHALLALAAIWGIHSHNDYAQPRPFYAAWESRAASIEADVYLVDGNLQVGHDRKDLKPERNLRRMYLEPLKKELARDPRSVILLVDIKEEDEKVLPELVRELKPLQKYLTVVKNGKLMPNRLTVIASGDRPVAAITALNPRTVFVDGRLENDQPVPTDPLVAPLISDDWTGLFKWHRGTGISLPDQARLAEIVYRVHRNGQILRFWGAPDGDEFYPILANAGVDLIGTDRLGQLAAFRDRKAR